jgi:hypothetical protein
LIAQDPKRAELIKYLLGGEDIRRNMHHKKEHWLNFARRGNNSTMPSKQG